MNQKLLEPLFARSETDKAESDFTYFFSLLLVSEAIAKTIVLGMLSALEDDTEANRYRLIHKLVRTNGLGDWSDAIQDILSGPASQFLVHEAHEERNQLNRRSSKGDWQYEAVASLKGALDTLSIDAEPMQTRVNMTKWFRLFATLRNKTRAHGAIRPKDCGN